MSERQQESIIPEFGDRCDMTYEESLEEICDMVLESIRESYHSHLEPWDIFEQKKKAALRKKVEVFQERFVRGFEVLLKELLKGHHEGVDYG